MASLQVVVERAVVAERDRVADVSARAAGVLRPRRLQLQSVEDARWRAARDPLFHVVCSCRAWKDSRWRAAKDPSVVERAVGPERDWVVERLLDVVDGLQVVVKHVVGAERDCVVDVTARTALRDVAEGLLEEETQNNLKPLFVFNSLRPLDVDGGNVE